MPGRVHPVPAAQDQPLRGFVNPCCGMCRGSGVFSCEGAGCCREGGTAACAFRNDARAYAHLFVSCSPLSVLTGSGSVENKRQTVRTKHNTFPWRGKEKNMSPHCQAGFKTPSPSPAFRAAALGAVADPPLGPARRALSSQTVLKLLALAGASAATAFLVYNCFK